MSSAPGAAVGPVKPRTVAFDVEGMTCAACVNRIERYLRKVDGVETAAVNLATERATVVAAEDVTTAQILRAIEAAGYDARLRLDDDDTGVATDVVAAGASSAMDGTSTSARPTASGAFATSARTAAAALPAGRALRDGTSRSPDRPFLERHLEDTRRRLTVAALLTVPLLGGLARMTIAPFLPEFLSNPWLQLAFATPVQVYAAAPFYRGAWNALRHASSDMNTLIAVGTSAAYGYSLAAILVPRASSVTQGSVSIGRLISRSTSTRRP